MTEITEWEVKKTRRGNRVETGMSNYEKRWIDDKEQLDEQLKKRWINVWIDG